MVTGRLQMGNGNQGYATDLAPNVGQWFYRIVAF